MSLPVELTLNPRPLMSVPTGTDVKGHPLMSGFQN